MAGADIDYLLTNTDKVNWLKGVLVMEITDEAIRPFVEQEIKTFHNDIKSNFRHGSICGNCMSTNAKHCPSGKCSSITSQIESAHRFNGPCYKNSHITKWLSDPWEIAKCYMSISTDLKGKPCSEIDFPSILNVVINNTRFERLITTVDMTNASNIFYQGRDARNESMHSRSYQTTETQLNRHCYIFIEIVKLIGRDMQTCVEKIEKVRDTPLSITTEDIVKLQEQAARYQGLPDAVIERMKKELWDEAERILMNIKDETEKAIGSSLIPNFVEGCKESLNRLIVEHIQRQKPKRIKENDWTVVKFIDSLEILPQVKELSECHREMLFPSSGSPLDITKLDMYLLCFVLKIEAQHPLENRVVKFIDDAKVLRNKLLDDPSGVDKSELSNLCGYLHKPMKDDVLRLFEKKRTLVDMINENNVLQSWRRQEDIEIQARYRCVDAARDADVCHNMAEMKTKISVLEALILPDIVSRLSKMEMKVNYGMNKSVENSEKGAADEAIESYETQVDVKPYNVCKTDEVHLQQTMTSSDQNNQVLNNTGARELFESATAGCTIKGISVGSIILKVGCPSLAALFGFWKGCTDGTVVKAMSKIRDAYRKYLGCDRLEFDIVLKKKEVARCKIKIIEDLNSRLERIEEQMTGVNDLIRRPVDDLNSRLQRLEEHVTGVTYLISQPVVERASNSDSTQTSEHDGDNSSAWKPEEMEIIPCITEDKDITVGEDIPIARETTENIHLLEGSPQYVDNGKHLPKILPDEEASKSDPESFGSAMSKPFKFSEIYGENGAIDKNYGEAKWIPVRSGGWMFSSSPLEVGRQIHVTLDGSGHCDVGVIKTDPRYCDILKNPSLFKKLNSVQIQKVKCRIPVRLNRDGNEVQSEYSGNIYKESVNKKGFAWIAIYVKFGDVLTQLVEAEKPEEMEIIPCRTENKDITVGEDIPIAKEMTEHIHLLEGSPHYAAKRSKRLPSPGRRNGAIVGSALEDSRMFRLRLLGLYRGEDDKIVTSSSDSGTDCSVVSELGDSAMLRPEPKRGEDDERDTGSSDSGTDCSVGSALEDLMLGPESKRVEDDESDTGSPSSDSNTDILAKRSKRFRSLGSRNRAIAIPKCREPILLRRSKSLD